MQTQCPHCDTKFRVTDNQLQAADGVVRCGVCSEVFNTAEMTNTSAQPTVPTNEPWVSNELYDTVNEEDLNPEVDKDVFDLFDEELNESRQHIVPEKYRDTYSPQPHSLSSTVLWSLGILILTATLVLEYIWFNRDQFMPVPELHTAFKQACKHLDCGSFSLRAPEQIELITRNVYSHPKEKGALLVDVTMKNNASFAQTYPVMQIEFSNIRGGTVAARRFFPDEYRPLDAQSKLLEPNTNTSVTLEIQDPGKQAMTYEFNFL
ncbi:hypothetical protein MNBD_GAMMA05-2565 [hydrothermal vent metagenome]|uniref:Zinc finger/thioredoxin putative domain-containing protein n=1 Tax=hydrothermal vent metagenome TaxID=652676 RepID=A0A3B0WJ37_9ZZZZ